MIEVTLLGCGGMMPMKNRWLTSCLLSNDGHSILVDCGEGTQIALKCAGKRTKPVDLICLTHFHADHMSGLPGFLLSMGNEGRTEPLTIAGPKKTAAFVSSLCVIAPNLPFRIDFRELDAPTSFMCGKIEVGAYKAKHKIECIGYSFSLPRQGEFDPVKAKNNGVPLKIWSKLQKEGEAELDGVHYTFDMVGGPTRKGLKVSYCTDSRPCRSIAEGASGSDLFICEGLYADPEKLGRAKETGHMLFSEAAELAKEIGASELWLTHFSPALIEPEEGLPFAKEIFPESYCGFDGKNVTLRFKD